MDIKELLDNRKNQIVYKKSKYPDFHFFLPVIKNTNYYNSTEEKIIMYMMYNLTLEGVVYSIKGNDTLYTNTINSYLELKSMLTHDIGKLLLNSLEFPLRAHFSYKKNQFEEAESYLVKSIEIYRKIFEENSSEIIWASIEQSLNRMRILIHQELPYVEKSIKIIEEVYTAQPNGFSNLSPLMCECLSKIGNDEKYNYLNYFIDNIVKKEFSIIFKAKIKDRNILKKFISELVTTKAYSHLNKMFQPYLKNEKLEVSLLLNNLDENTEIPSTLEGILLSSTDLYSQNPLEIDTYLQETYNIELK